MENKSATRDVAVRRVLVVEGAVNFGVLVLKGTVALATGSVAILSDALHSLTDVANNAVAWFVLRLSSEPPDERHPYGHRKFETVAVFGLAMLLTLLAFELGLHALRREEGSVLRSDWTFGLMGLVLCVNVGLAVWEGQRARRLDSDILRADARHTLADVLTTVAVIAGWQAASHGYYWADRLVAIGMAAVIWWLAFGLFRRSIPVLVDAAPLAPQTLVDAASSVPGVLGVRSIRSRGPGQHASVDLVALVAPELDTVAAHDIASAVERAIRAALPVDSVVVHVEPAQPVSARQTD